MALMSVQESLIGCSLLCREPDFVFAAFGREVLNDDVISVGGFRLPEIHLRRWRPRPSESGTHRANQGEYPSEHLTPCKDGRTPCARRQRRAPTPIARLTWGHLVLVGEIVMRNSRPDMTEAPSSHRLAGASASV